MPSALLGSQSFWRIERHWCDRHGIRALPEVMSWHYQLPPGWNATDQIFQIPSHFQKPSQIPPDSCGREGTLFSELPQPLFLLDS